MATTLWIRHVLYFLVSWFPLTCAQSTTLSASSNTVGYIVNTDGSEPRPIIYSNDNWEVTTTELGLTTLVGAYSQSAVEIGFSCSLDEIWWASGWDGTSTYRATESCLEGCVTVEVVPTWPSHTDRWTYYECLNHLRNIDPGSLTIYRVVPPMTTSESISESSSTAESTGTETQEDDDDDDDDTDGGPSTGVIVGAVVGSVGAVALIAVAFWLGLRFARRRQAPTSEPAAVAETGMPGHYASTMSTIPGYASPGTGMSSPPPFPGHQSYLQHSPPPPPPDGADQLYKTGAPVDQAAMDYNYRISTVPPPAPMAMDDGYGIAGTPPLSELTSVPLTDPTRHEMSSTPRV